jgi:23S rRNA pseudouridine1911/1915/1917 synthase
VEKTLDLIVDRADEDARLDVFISRRLGIPRSLAAHAIDEGRVLTDGRARKPSFRLKTGMRVQAGVPEEIQTRASSPQAVDIPLTVLYEDAHIIVVDKPAGLVVHPGAGKNEATLVHALLHRYPEIAGVGAPERPGIVHRLDKLTSGVMVAARSGMAYAALAAAFKEHLHTRIYRAVCYGRMDRHEGRIETFMDRRPGDRKKMTSRVAQGRQAVTDWLVVREWGQLSLLELRLQTGRTHQIRVHLADMGHPVAGDPEYGGKRRANTLTDPVLRSRVKRLGRQMLHAWKLGITHPATGQRMEFTSELPEDMKGLIALLDERMRVSGAARE